MNLAQQLSALIAQQQVAVGMIGAAAAGTIMFSLKALPGQIWAVLKDQFSVTLSVTGTDPAYEHLNLWFSRNQAVKHARRLMLQEEFDYDKGDWRWRFTLGHGHHLIWAGGSPMLIHRSLAEGAGELGKLLGKSAANQKLEITTLGRRQTIIREAAAEAETIANEDGRVRVYFWAGHGYQLADRRAPRPMDTVYLPDEQKRRIITDALTFIAAKADYTARGTPYRRGYLFEGPPGTGKTSLIFALAGLLDRSVYVINLSNVYGDNALMGAFNEVGPAGVVVIEDIDTAEVGKNRSGPPVSSPVPGAPGQPVAPVQINERITLSGLLNAIDGVAAREGRMLFVTSNHTSHLDPALLRSGRIDVRETIDRLDFATARRMFCAFRPDAGPGEFERMVAHRLLLAAADLQNLLQEAERPTDIAIRNVA